MRVLHLADPALLALGLDLGSPAMGVLSPMLAEGALSLVIPLAQFTRLVAAARSGALTAGTIHLPATPWRGRDLARAAEIPLADLLRDSAALEGGAATEEEMLLILSQVLSALSARFSLLRVEPQDPLAPIGPSLDRVQRHLWSASEPLFTPLVVETPEALLELAERMAILQERAGPIADAWFAALDAMLDGQEVMHARMLAGIGPLPDPDRQDGGSLSPEPGGRLERISAPRVLAFAGGEIAVSALFRLPLMGAGGMHDLVRPIAMAVPVTEEASGRGGGVGPHWLLRRAA